MIVTVDLARELLQYPKVVQRPYHVIESGTRYEIFSAIPDDEAQWSVDLYFNESCDVVDLVSFGQWHAHYDSSENEEENIRNAFSTARALVLHERCLFAEYDADGRPLGESTVAPGEFPETLSPKAASFRRVLFGQKPQEEVVDFSLYHRGQHLWISLARKAEVERIYREHGIPIPEF